MRASVVVIAVLALIVLAIVLLFGLAWRPELSAISPPAQPAFDAALIARGSQLAALGNCHTCHTAPGGADYAGRKPMPTPFGTIYSTNITPDPETGIGRWSQEAFDRAMRQGVDREGDHLYPAFPYDHFTRMRAEDLTALYAFIMTREAVRAEPVPNLLPFPFNFRPLLAGWKMLFLRQGQFEPQPQQSDEWNRGAYLVQGVAHCGGCHTPRNKLGAEEKHNFLAGGLIDEWKAPAINKDSPSPRRWSVESLYRYLREGLATDHAIPAGPMKPVVHNLAAAAEQDVHAIATYIGSLMEQAPSVASNDLAELTERARTTAGPGASAAAMQSSDPTMRLGASLYADACSSCHARGRGLSTSEDALLLPLGVGLHMSTPRNVIRIVLEGIEPAPGQRGRWMPSFAGAFTDEQLVALLTYLRGAFTKAPAWPDLAHEVRTATQKRTGALVPGG